MFRVINCCLFIYSRKKFCYLLYSLEDMIIYYVSYFYVVVDDGIEVYLLLYFMM